MNQNPGVPQPPYPTYAQSNYNQRKLYRSTRDKWIAGVCGGIAERYDHDPTLIRILWIGITIVTGILGGVLVYILLWAFIKKYPSYFTPPALPPDAESVHYHYHYRNPRSNNMEE
jgi:phage shock protein C